MSSVRIRVLFSATIALMSFGMAVLTEWKFWWSLNTAMNIAAIFSNWIFTEKTVQPPYTAKNPWGEL